MQVMRPRDVKGQAERRDQRRAGHQDDRRAGQRDQAGGRRVEAADVPVREPGGGDQRPPQVVGKRPLRPAQQRRAQGGGVHPHHDQASRRDQRERPPPYSLPHPASRPLRMLARRLPHSPPRRSGCAVPREPRVRLQAQPGRSSACRLTACQLAKPVTPPAEAIPALSRNCDDPAPRGPSQVDYGAPDDIGPRGKGDPSRPPRREPGRASGLAFLPAYPGGSSPQ